MTRKYFGTDGVRGTVGSSPMTPDFVLRLGYAGGKVLAGRVKNPAVLIGKDTRISGYMLESALEAGFSAAGRVPGGGGRRAQVRPDPAARRGLPDARAAALGGRGDQRLAQSLPG